ncbi:MAG: hypothetical protein ACTHNW_15655 [Mucilaginibacter sp.]
MYSSLTISSTAHCRLGYFFSLDRKEAKDQAGKNLPPAGHAPGPVFRQAFTRDGATNNNAFLSAP